MNVMNVKHDIEELSDQTKKLINRDARRLLEDFPDTHTIVIDRKTGVTKARELADFELLLFIGDNDSTDCSVSEPTFIAGSEKSCDSYPVYDPGRNYVRNDRPLPSEETDAVHYKFASIKEERNASYLELLKEHLKQFSRNQAPDITTVNSSAMKSCDPLFYKLFISYRSNKGYLLYNRFIKPLLLRWDLTE